MTFVKQLSLVYAVSVQISKYPPLYNGLVFLECYYRT
jgi:hypothetical protein